MEIQGRTVLVLGGWGLVGAAICRELLPRCPRRLVVASLTRAQAEEAVEQYRGEFPSLPVEMVPAWGSIFVRQEWKDVPWGDLLADPVKRAGLLDDSLGALTDEVLEASALYRLVREHRPDVIVDCINSATVFAYQDMYKSVSATRRALDRLEAGEIQVSDFRHQIEESLLVGAVPQLIRHTQILHQAMTRHDTRAYVKIGTSGTGGMGLNIPYTHSEEKPSRMLLTKSAMAGAHTLLLFLMARTPGGPIIKEFKPTAAIAWKGIDHGPVRRRGRPIELIRVEPEDAVDVAEAFRRELPPEVSSRIEGRGGSQLEEVFIDTGENGSFSLAEFEAVTTIGQMEFITPEEIARAVTFDLEGGNTGHDVLDGLDMVCMGPTYRAGAVRAAALERMRKLEEEHGSASVAFENLGPPRLSKLLYEAHLLKRAVSSLKAVAEAEAEALSARCEEMILEDAELLSRIVSIGIPVLLSDGRRLLRGPEVHVPVFPGDEQSLPLPDEGLDAWAAAGWVDLRVENMQRWRERAEAALAEAGAIPAGETSSRFHRDLEWWHVERPLDEGRVVGWLFIQEEKGSRMKR